jgi:hypothetical protein
MVRITYIYFTTTSNWSMVGIAQNKAKAKHFPSGLIVKEVSDI